MPLETIADQVTVGHVGSMASEYVEQGIPFLRSTNVEPYRIDRNDIRYITPEFHERLSKSALGPGDVVVVRTGSPGTAAVIPPSLPVANCSDLVIIRPSDRVLPRYLAYYINSAAQGHIRSRIVGAVQQHFNVGAAKELPVSLPPIREQESIVEALGSLDEKIELNRGMNRTLETTAQTIFRSWFVDFDPVVAKADRRDPVGISDDVAALFPDGFVDSELDRIPKGWKPRNLAGLVDLTAGRSYKSAELEDSEVALVSLKSFKRGGGYRPGGLKPYTGRFKDAQVVEPGEIVLARTDMTQAAEVIGRPAIVRPDDRFRQLVASLDLLIVRPKDASDLPRSFLYWLMRSPDFERHMLAHANGTTVLHLSKDAVPTYAFAYPGRKLVRTFADLVEPIMSEVRHNEEESQTLVALRDLLLPKLLSGEVRIPEAEEAMEAAGA